MMGQLKHEQEQLFYEFRLDEVVPGDHLVREIAAVLDLTWVRAELASYYSPLGRPSHESACAPISDMSLVESWAAMWSSCSNGATSLALPRMRS